MSWATLEQTYILNKSNTIIPKGVKKISTVRMICISQDIYEKLYSALLH